jgi:hypothetical protein
MNAVEKIRKTLEDRERALSKLTDEQKAVREKIDALQKDRGQAVRDLAALSDESKAGPLRKKVADLDGKMAPLNLRLEGIGKLIEEAEGEVTTARAALKDAERVQAEQLAESIRKDEEKRRTAFVKSLPGRLQRIIDSYLAACNDVGEILIEGSWVDDGGVHLSLEAEDFLRKLPAAIGEETRVRDYRRQNHAPWSDAIVVVPFTPSSAEGFVSGHGRLEAGTVALNRHRKRITELKGELEGK